MSESEKKKLKMNQNITLQVYGTVIVFYFNCSPRRCRCKKGK